MEVLAQAVVSQETAEYVLRRGAKDMLLTSEKVMTSAFFASSYSMCLRIHETFEISEVQRVSRCVRERRRCI